MPAGLCFGEFARVIAELEGPDFRRCIAEKFAVDLADRPTLITVRGYSRLERDGRIHTDSKSKLITILAKQSVDFLLIMFTSLFFAKSMSVLRPTMVCKLIRNPILASSCGGSEFSFLKFAAFGNFAEQGDLAALRRLP